MKGEESHGRTRGLHTGWARRSQGTVGWSRRFHRTTFWTSAALLMPSRHIALWEHIFSDPSPPKEISPGTTIISDAHGCRRILSCAVSCSGKEDPCTVREGRGGLALTRAATAFNFFSVGFFIRLLIVIFFTSVFRRGGQRWLRIRPLGLDGCWRCR